MYIDKNILKIIFKTKSEEELNEVSESYKDNLENLVVKVVEEIITNPDIPKPKVQGMQGLIDIPEDKIASMSEEELGKRMIHAMNVATSLPFFSSMLTRYVKRFNQTLIETQLPNLSKEEYEEFQNYLKQLNKNIIENEETFDQAGKELADVVGIEDFHLDKFNFSKIEDTEPVSTPQTHSTETQAAETTPVPAAPAQTLEPVTPEAVIAEETTEPSPAPVEEIKEPEVLTPEPLVQTEEKPETPTPEAVEAAPQLTPTNLPPTTDLPQRKLSVGAEPEEPKPVSFAR